ncbi:MurR/RpiR family transcriptional regulator [Vibrio sp. DW001]|uniref:MurR/RpiR family transcriptional regulator n=1 Tax=Vibrio sp. DW001 TaxID=2912315 RepID=UPI0023B163F5|nr:MurR/RpiR family transcriptional regulator [Vibrio sp. DW001]WED25793.1 MurR/RpiR family transcriptional regulator [Vibrio sp. DW001]
MAENKQPQDLDLLKELIAKKYDSLSARLQQTADFILAEPMVIAIEKMTVIAEKANVPLSTLSRFSNTMGFSGFSEMQILFKDHFFNIPVEYENRIKKAYIYNDLSSKSSLDIFKSFGDANLEAMKNLQHSVSADKLNRALHMLNNAETIYIHGTRRAFPVAFYFWYALMKSDKSVVLLDDAGGMLKPLTRAMNSKDVLFSVTFTPYAPETTEVIELAKGKDVPSIVISDSHINEIGKKTDVCFVVEEGNLMGFRSLSSSIYLTQSLAVSLMCQNTIIE